LDGFVNADVRGQVTAPAPQDYQEGALVSKDQLLFEIDPRPFQAALDQAEGQLAQATAQLANAEAIQGRTQLDVERYIRLRGSRQRASRISTTPTRTFGGESYSGNGNAKSKQPRPLSKRPSSTLGLLGLRHPSMALPGRAQLQVGALVSTSSTPVTTVSTVNPSRSILPSARQNISTSTEGFPTESSRQAEFRRLPLD